MSLTYSTARHGGLLCVGLIFLSGIIYSGQSGLVNLSLNADSPVVMLRAFPGILCGYTDPNANDQTLLGIQYDKG